MRVTKDPRKLTLSKETVRSLADRDARLAVAGVGSGRFTFCAGCTDGGSCT
jgi:hypothetical protein